MLEGTIPNREARPAVEALSEAAARFGTPVYVIGMAEVAAAAARLEATFDRPWLRLYSLKANDLPAITSFLDGRGQGASVVSAGEWRPAQAGGVPNEPVAFEGLGKTDAQLELVVAEAVAGRPLRWLGIESVQEGASFTSRYNGRPRPAEVLLWLDGSLQPCERPPTTPAALTPGRTLCSAARPTRPKACHAVGSATVTKESLP